MINIIDKHDCCGCTACESICGAKAISMQPDEEGFLYPHVDLAKCTDCKLCERVCPIISRDKRQPDTEPIKVFALHNKDINVWEKSSSGGVFSALADNCLKDGGIVYGAEFDDDFVVVHKGETTKEGVLKFRGSKYVQSDLQGVYAEIRTNLKNGKKVLFSGVPCQVEGLKNFLLKPYDNLTTIDILCHGVPSPKVFQDYVNYIHNIKKCPLKSIFMKDKTLGWGHQNLRLTYKDGTTEFNTPVSNLWNNLFYDQIINRPSCHQCRFKNLHRSGDISIGDFWGIEESHPEFNSKKGIALMLVNNSNGELIWELISNNFDYIELDTADYMQPVLLHSQPESVDRSSFWNKYLKYGFRKTVIPRYKLYVRKTLRRHLSTIKNLIFR